jgi:hypothetical protein
MESNPYAPPLAAVQDAQPSAGVLPPYFAVSVFKLGLMCICTLGFYQLYWFYKQWHSIRRREHTNVLPAARALFSVFYCYPCFRRIREHGVQMGIQPSLQAGAIATGFILCSLTWRLPDPYGWIAMASMFFLLPVQAHANEINAVAAPAHERNAKLTGWNWLAIVPGGTLMLLAIIGSFLPET